MNVDEMESAVAALQRAVEEQEQEQDPSLEDLQAWGRLLPDITYALAMLARTLQEQALQIDDRYFLRDDAGMDQEERMLAVSDSSRAFNTLMEQANPSTCQFQEYVGHLEVESEAPPEQQGRETRKSTAAKLARRDTASTNIDPEPRNMMPSRPLGKHPKP